jgi:DNA-binding NarL/FixJ family response regulator
MAENKVTVLVVDDHTLVRRAVMEALSLNEGVQVLGEASDGAEGVKKAKELMPDVVVMDLQMPVMGGVEATKLVSESLLETQVLVLTVSDSEDDLFAAIKAGAKGYLLKPFRSEDLYTAVFHIAQGGVMVSPAMATSLLTQLNTPAAKPDAEVDTSLSEREKEVLQQLSQGASNKEVSATLFITENTVKTHLRNIMDKLHLANRSQAAAYAVRTGLHRFQPGDGKDEEGSGS